MKTRGEKRRGVGHVQGGFFYHGGVAGKAVGRGVCLGTRTMGGWAENLQPWIKLSGPGAIYGIYLRLLPSSSLIEEFYIICIIISFPVVKPEKAITECDCGSDFSYQLMEHR